MKIPRFRDFFFFFANPLHYMLTRYFLMACFCGGSLGFLFPSFNFLDPKFYLLK